MPDLRSQEVNAMRPYCTGRGLDVGCGYQKSSPNAIGLDKAPRGATTEPHGHISVADIAADALYLPFKSGVFDFVTASHTIEHLSDPKSAVKEWIRTLKPGGYLATVTPLGRFTKGMDRTHIHDDLTEDEILDIVYVDKTCKLAQYDSLKNNWSCDVVLQKPMHTSSNKANDWSIEGVRPQSLIESRKPFDHEQRDTSVNKTSIIIPCYNTTEEQVDITRKCFENIKKFTTLPHELLVVDNASTQGRELLEEHADIVIRNPKNLGCAKAWNQGIRIATGEYICVMNNDLLIFQDWLRILIEELESDPEFGIVGPDVMQHLGYDKVEEAEERAKELATDNHIVFANRGDGFGGLFLAHASLYEEVGPFDENFELGMFEDRDLWVRVQDAGYKILRTQRAWCFHIGNMTWGKLENQEEIFKRNQAYFEKKHAVRYPDLSPIPQSPSRVHKKIALLTTFQNFEHVYSLTGVVRDQLDVMKRHGYDPVLIACEDFSDENEAGLTIDKCIPAHKLTDYQLDTPKQADFDAQVEEIEAALVEHLADFDIVITHDIMFLTWFLPHNQAVRNCAEQLPDIRWLHWMHSAPSAPPEKLEYPHTLRFTGMENSKFVSLLHWETSRVAKMYDIPESDIRVAHNPKDIRSFFGFDDITNKIIQRYDLLSTDVLCVYPTRMTPAKQPDKALKIVAKIKEQGLNAKIVFCNSYSNAKEQLDYMRKLKRTAKGWGLEQDDVVFTSEQGYPIGVPQRVVRELLQLANIFIMPSISETCSLTTLEAALAKNLLILNDDFPPMREVGGHNALYFKFSSALFRTEYHPSEEAYFHDCALSIIAELNANKSLGAFREIKQKFNADYIFKHEIEPLFYQ